MLLRRIVSLALLVVLASSTQAATRWLTEREGAPLRWQGWGPAAFERAKKENRPLFVFAGTAASYQHYRMHREVFLIGEIAEYVNAYFVPVLLDRIEYPEIAEAYERMFPGSTIFLLTPSLEPFAGAGFVRPDEMNRLLVIHANRWASEKDAVIAEARAHVEKAREAGVPPQNETFTREQLLELAASPRHDHLGGGFHRSAEALEKMLPDQARLARAYLDASQIHGDPELAHIARTTLDYVLRDLRFPDRAPFEAFQDAHSLVPGQGPVFVNGAFYVWDTKEVADLVGRDDAGKIARLFDLRDEEKAKPALRDTRSLHELRDELATPLAKMLAVRQKRPAPFREATVVAGWNGLMISALARGAVVLNEPKYLEAAIGAASYVTMKMWNPATKTLKRTDGGVDALAEDYAFLIQGLLDLFESSYDPKWLEVAIALQQRQDGLFRDASVSDVTATNLLRLATLTGTEPWHSRAAAPQLAASRIVVVTGDLRKQETRDLLAALHARWEPLRAIVFLPAKGPSRERVVRLLPWTGALQPDPERVIAYLCAKGECTRESAVRSRQ